MGTWPDLKVLLAKKGQVQYRRYPLRKDGTRKEGLVEVKAQIHARRKDEGHEQHP